MDPAAAPHRGPNCTSRGTELPPGGTAPPSPPGPSHDAPLPRALREALEETPPRPRVGPTLAWGAACLTLILLLAGQILYHERLRLLEIPVLAPWVRGICAPLPCALPPPRDLEALRLAHRHIQALPDRPGVLHVSAGVKNTADFPQPAPVIELTFRDAQGAPVAARRFFPADYPPENGTGATMAPDEIRPLERFIADPGPAAMAFEFRFLPAPRAGDRL